MTRGFSGVRTGTLSEIADNLREIKDGQAAQRDFERDATGLLKGIGDGQTVMHTELKGDLAEVKGALGDIKDILGEIRDTLRDMRAMRPVE